MLSFYHSQSDEQKRFIESAVTHRELPPAFYVVAAMVYVHVLIYIVMSLQKVLNYRNEIKHQFASIRKINLDWLVFLILSVTLILLLSWVSVMIPVTGARGWFEYSLLAIIFILFIFINLVVLKGLNQPEIFAGLETGRPVVDAAMSPLVSSESELIQNRLEDLMRKEKVFLDSELNLESLAARAGISAKKLSQVINTTYQKNFFDFVNAYRIEEAMRILRESSDPGLTVLEAMYQSGFNSKSSFNTIFKKTTGLTPSAYRYQHRPS